MLVTVAFLLLLFPFNAAAEPGLEHLEDGRTLYQAGHWDDAQMAFQRAYEESAAKGEIRAATALEWGSLLWEQGSYPRAEELVRESLHLARELGLNEATGQLLITLGHIEAARGALASAENTLNLCVQLAGEMGDSVNRALCRMNRRVVRTLRGRDPGSETDFRADIEALRESNTPLSVGAALSKTAQLYMEHHDLDRAETLLEEAQRAYQRSGSVPALTRNRLRIAQLMHRKGDFEEARPRIDGLLTQFETMRNRPLQIQTLALRAESEIHRGDRSAALGSYQRALQISQNIENPQMEGRIHLAVCEMEVGQSPSHCDRASAIFARFQMPFLEIRALSGQGRLLQRQGDLGNAVQVYGRALQRLEETVEIEGPHRLTKGLLQANLCQARVQIEVEGAFELCSEALRLIHSQEESVYGRYESLRAAVHYSAGRAAIAENRGTSALNHLEEAARLYQGLTPPQPLMAADVLLRRGIVQANAGSERALARGTFEEAMELLEDLEARSDVLRTRVSLLNQMAQYDLAEEQWERSLQTLSALQTAARRADDLRSQAWAESARARAYLRTDRQEEAKAALERALPLAERSGDDALVSTIQRNLARF